MSGLEAILSDPPPRVERLDDWWPIAEATGREVESPLLAVAAAGARADRLAWAFASAYQAALRRLVPDLPPGVASLAVTEDAGNHPRSLNCRIEAEAGAWVAQGTKAFTTLGTAADHLIVVGVGGDAEPAPGHPTLAALRVSSAAPGVHLEPGPETPFTPEIPHARLRLERAPGALLPGDGYLVYMKGFRVIEDLFVLGAGLGCLLAAGRRAGLPRASVERGLAALAGLAHVQGLDLTAPATHAALAGLFGHAHAVIDEAYGQWANLEGEAWRRFERDRPLLSIAGRARQTRAERAWQRLAPAQSEGPA